MSVLCICFYCDTGSAFMQSRQIIFGTVWSFVITCNNSPCQPYLSFSSCSNWKIVGDERGGGRRRRGEKRDSVNYKESATSQVLWIQFLMYRIRFQQQTGSGRIRNTHGQQTVPQIILAKTNLLFQGLRGCKKIGAGKSFQKWKHQKMLFSFTFKIYILLGVAPAYLL